MKDEPCNVQRASNNFQKSCKAGISNVDLGSTFSRYCGSYFRSKSRGNSKSSAFTIPYSYSQTSWLVVEHSILLACAHISSVNSVPPLYSLRLTRFSLRLSRLGHFILTINRANISFQSSEVGLDKCRTLYSIACGRQCCGTVVLRTAGGASREAMNYYLLISYPTNVFTSKKSKKLQPVGRRQ